MEPTIQNKNSILNQLEWDFFVKKASSHALFSKTGPRVFDQEVDEAKVEAVMDMTELFLSPESYEQTNEIRFELAALQEDMVYEKAGSRLSKGGVYELEELVSLISMLETVVRHCPFLRGCAFEAKTHLDEEFAKDFKRNVLREFRSFVSPEGEVDYFKHPKLKELYRKQLELESTIRATLGGLKNDSAFQNAMQFQGHDLINDKYVLPIKSDAYSSALGLIIARSETGRTLYVEPSKIRNLNRERFETVLKIDQIIHQIAKDFCSRLSKWGELIDDYAKLCLLFDEYWVRSRFASDMRLTRPKLSKEPGFSLEGFFHPLLENPVTNDMRLGIEQKGVLISGPNTGGKTASIKAVALTCLFAKRGLFAPARSAKLHLFENVFYFGNDRQNLPEGLSSFAAEAKSYAELLDQLGSSNLIIIDEVFNSTSSEEASALAIAFFNRITKNGRSKVLVSTHHQTLKTLAHSRDDYISCHVGFDAETNSPTYKLIYGFPGKSMALEVFRQMMGDKPECMEIYKDASLKLDNKMINYEKLLHHLSQKEEKLNRLIRQNERVTKELQNQKESAKGVAKLKVEEEVAKAKKELEKIAAKARNAYEKAKKGEFSSTRKLEKELAESQARLKPFAREDKDFKDREKTISMPKPKELVPGERYFCSFVNQTVTLKEVKKGSQAIVSKGAMNIKVPASSLFQSNKGHKEEQVVVTAQRNSVSKIEYDCRGMRLSEFQNLVESSVPDILSGSVPYVNFIHGHGNGTLKDWLRKYIKNTSAIEWDKGESGNDGETRVIATR